MLEKEEPLSIAQETPPPLAVLAVTLLRVFTADYGMVGMATPCLPWQSLPA